MMAMTRPRIISIASTRALPARVSPSGAASTSGSIKVPTCDAHDTLPLPSRPNTGPTLAKEQAAKSMTLKEY